MFPHPLQLELIPGLGRLSIMVHRLLLLAALLCPLALAQERTAGTSPQAADGAPANSAASSGPASSQWRGLSVEEKLKYDGKHLFDPGHIFFGAIGAGFDQLRERPQEWGDGYGPYGERFASHFGQYLVQRSIMFPIQAIDHEDTRYFRSRSGTYKGRLRDALLQTVWRHNDNGGMMIAYSEFLGDFGGAAVSRMWWPAHYHTASSVLIAGGNSILVDGWINVLHEFSPDMKRWIRLKR